MQRSRSSTGIPIRSTNLFGAAKSDHKPSMGARERSRSTTSRTSGKRMTSLDRLTPASQQFGSTSKQSGHYSQKKSWTPSTPSVYSDRKRGTSSNLRPTFYGEAAAETKILQKQINDKKWIAEKYTKVQEFIQASGLFDPQLATQIKPTTIKTFVTIFSTLFNEIHPIAVNLNSQNYAEVTVQNLKLLGYPGAVTVSAVKTANTMHGWPNFIAMTSWLVEKVSITTLDLSQPAEDRKISDILSFAYNKWASSQGETVVEDVLSPDDLERFKDDYAAILGVDEEEDKRLSEMIESRVAKLKEYEDLERVNSELRMEIQSKKDVINSFNCDTGEKQEKLDFKLSKAKKHRDQVKEREKELNTAVNSLSSQIGSQSCKIIDKNRMLIEIENYKKDAERRRANIMEYYCIRDEMDIDYQSKISELEKAVDSWNVVLTKTFLPEMEKLRLRDKGFHSHTFLEEIRERQKLQLLMEDSFVEETERIKVEIEELEKRKKELIKTNGKVHDLLMQIKNLKKDQMEILEEIEKLQNQHEQTIKDIQDQANERFLEETKEIEENEKRLEMLQKKFEQVAKEGVAAAVATHKNVSEKIVECHELVKNLTDLKFNQVQKYRDVLRSKLLESQKLKTLLESVEQEWNEPLFMKEEEESI